MSLVCVGLNHQTAPMGLLEKVSFAQVNIDQLLLGLTSDKLVHEAVGLCTCNRMEFYFFASQGADPVGAVMAGLLRGLAPDDARVLRESFYIHRDGDAARHIFRVAAGIDSLIVGEAQILGQLRGAFQDARALGTSGEYLDSLLQAAINFGRRVRMETSIGRGNMSVASISCRLAADRFDSLHDKSLLLVGAGETSRLAGRHFVKEGIGTVRVLNRTARNAEALAAELNGEALGCWDLREAIDNADIIVCATGAPHHIITRELLEEAAPRDNRRPLLLVDLSMPRNVEPGVDSLPGVVLHALDSLEEIARGNRANREAEIVHVERLVVKETRRFLDWAASSCQNQVAATLRRRVSAIHRRVRDRHLRGADPEVAARVDKFADSLLRATFHDVTEYIRSLDLETAGGQRDLEAIKRIFALEERVVAKAAPGSQRTLEESSLAG